MRPFVPRTRIVEVYKAMQLVYPGLEPDALFRKVGFMLNIDVNLINQVINSELVETEGGSPD